MTSKKNLTLSKLKLIPTLGEEMEHLFYWLQQSKLTHQGQSYQKNLFENPPEYGRLYNENSLTVIATPTQRAKKLTQDEIKNLKKEYQEKGKTVGLEGVNKELIWRTIQSSFNNIRELEHTRLPADAMAFYRPFHFPPFDQWGIYLLIEPLLSYHQKLKAIACNTGLFSEEVLIHLVLFEIFHHEFFHHLTESAATTIEILQAAIGRPKQIYLDYKKRQYDAKIDYPHSPLEEALANAYAWNSLGFISRVKLGYKTSIVKLYQKVIEKHWRYEPAGYRDAAFYIKYNHVIGGAHLLAQIIGKSKADDNVPLMKLAKSVMPSGFSAFVAKPDIPAWLVGSPDDINTFHELIPAPNEAYTQLFWPYDTSEIDQYIQQKKKEEKSKRSERPTS